jgi:hypothetical protein
MKDFYQSERSFKLSSGRESVRNRPPGMETMNEEKRR